MNTRFAALLMTAMTVLTVSGPVSADPFFRGGDWPVVREDRGHDRQDRRDEREARKDQKQSGKKSGREAGNEDHEPGYGYGYERRSGRPHFDDRGRR